MRAHLYWQPFVLSGTGASAGTWTGQEDGDRTGQQSAVFPNNNNNNNSNNNNNIKLNVLTMRPTQFSVLCVY